jgi:RAD51-like protein 1
MSGRRLARVGLENDIVNGLSARGVNTARELLELTAEDISELLDVSLQDAKAVQSRVAQTVCPEPVTVLALLQRRATEPHHLSFDLKPLDEALRGGIPVGGITELVGPAGVGKTQFCKQLAVRVQLPVSEGGLGGSVIFIDTESRFSAARLVEIARTRWPQRFASDEAAEALARNVVLFSPASSAELQQRLESLEATIIERGARLVIVDSIAALVRSEFGRERLVERQALLGEQAARLKVLAEAFRIPVLVTNQVTTKSGERAAFDAARSRDVAPGADVDAVVSAALGTKWAHDVNLRLALEQGDATGQRYVSIAKSSSAPPLRFPYEVRRHKRVRLLPRLNSHSGRLRPAACSYVDRRWKSWRLERRGRLQAAGAADCFALKPSALQQLEEPHYNQRRR